MKTLLFLSFLFLLFSCEKKEDCQTCRTIMYSLDTTPQVIKQWEVCSPTDADYWESKPRVEYHENGVLVAYSRNECK